MNLGAALVEELDTVGPGPTLLGRMLHILVNTPEGQAGRPAAAIGVTPRTWNSWLSAARGLGGSRPSPASMAKLDAAVRRVNADLWRRRRPTRVTIRAKVKWNGYHNVKATRTTTLTDLDLSGMIDAYAEGSTTKITARFLAAVRARYGVPVSFTNITSLKIN